MDRFTALHDVPLTRSPEPGCWGPHGVCEGWPVPGPGLAELRGDQGGLLAPPLRGLAAEQPPGQHPRATLREHSAKPQVGQTAIFFKSWWSISLFSYSFRHSLRKIAAFLGYKEDQGRMDCAIHYSTGLQIKCQKCEVYRHFYLIFATGYFKRNHKKDIQKSPYTPEQVAIIKSSINKLNEVLMKSQKETLPLDLYEYYE